MGQVLTAGAGQNPARQAAINAGIPISKKLIQLIKYVGLDLEHLYQAINQLN